jgi:tRNA(Ile)-lysidine synthetase-like protein
MEQPSASSASLASLANLIHPVPGGPWAVGVSGGADSVALLELLRSRRELSLHVVHLDHETRGAESAGDARFVRDLASQWGLPHTIATRGQIERYITNRLPANRSARFRALRLELFRHSIAEHQLQGVMLAHHADDRAETVMQRLLRGSGPTGLTGMSPRTCVSGVTILRPLLGVRREALRELLRSRGIEWREDASNQSPLQQRNRVRALLSRRPELTTALTELADGCAALMSWLRHCGPELGDSFDVEVVCAFPPPLAREALRRWLARRAGAHVNVTTAAAERLLEMACDRATPPRQNFPGGLLVRRRGGNIFVDSPRLRGRRC